MKKIYTLLFAGLLTASAYSQKSVTEAMNMDTQNFDTLETSATATLPANWRVINNALTPGTFLSYNMAGTATTQRGGTSMSTSAANGIYNFGAGDPTTAEDRAIGGLSSGSNSKNVTIYHYLKNDDVKDISDFNISFNIEKYRNGSNAAGFSMKFYYSFDGSTWQDAPAAFNAVFGAGTDNSGVDPAPSVTTPINNQKLNVSLPAGADMYFAWNYSVSTGAITSNAIALGLDDVSITANYAGTLPLKLVDFRLMQSGNAVSVNWAASSESNMSNYEVQKSEDGANFNVLGRVNALNTINSKYNYLDATPKQGYNYYRLRSVEKTGGFTYSQVLRINMGVSKTGVAIISNPVYDHNINLQLSNFDKGKYALRVFNGVGQQVYSRSINHAGGSSTEIINLPQQLSPGIYVVNLTDGTININKQVLVN